MVKLKENDTKISFFIFNMHVRLKSISFKYFLYIAPRSISFHLNIWIIQRCYAGTQDIKSVITVRYLIIHYMFTFIQLNNIIIFFSFLMKHIEILTRPKSNIIMIHFVSFFILFTTKPFYKMNKLEVSLY